MAKQNKYKGVKKYNKDSDENPLLQMDDKDDFSTEFVNILNNPKGIIFKDYKNFNIVTGNIDADLLNDKSEIIAIMRYYEYACIARFKYSYIVPMLTDGELNGNEVFAMIQHALRNKLLMNIPSFDVILEIEFKFSTKIKYNKEK
jgi:hypothetical protein